MLAAPRRLLTPTIVLAAVLSNTASEMGYVVLIPLAAVIYHSVGRHPFVGLAAAFAGVSGGYSANLFIGTVDPLLAGITTEAAAIVGGADYEPGGSKEVLATANWYFMAISTLMITVLGTLVTERLVAPWLGEYDESAAEEGALEASQDGLQPLDAREKRALRWAGITLAGLIAVLLALVLPEGGAFRAPRRGGGRHLRGEDPPSPEERGGADLRLLRCARFGVRADRRDDAGRPGRHRRDGRGDERRWGSTWCWCSSRRSSWRSSSGRTSALILAVVGGERASRSANLSGSTTPSSSCRSS